MNQFLSKNILNLKGTMFYIFSLYSNILKPYLEVFETNWNDNIYIYELNIDLIQHYKIMKIKLFLPHWRWLLWPWWKSLFGWKTIPCYIKCPIAFFMNLEAPKTFISCTWKMSWGCTAWESVLDMSQFWTIYVLYKLVLVIERICFEGCYLQRNFWALIM